MSTHRTVPCAFAAPVEINGKKGNVGVVVQRVTGTNRFKTLRILLPNGKAFEFVKNNEADSTTGSSSKHKGSEGIPIESASMTSIRNPDEIVNTETQKAEEKKSERDEEFDYSGLNWATELGIITAKDRAIFERTINNEIYRGAKPQSANGEYIIDTGKCLLFTDGDFHRPTLSRVVVFSTEYESLIDESKRRIIYEAGSTGDIQVSQRIIENLYGPGFAVEYTPGVYQSYAGQNRGGKRANSKRGNRNYPPKSLREILAAEGKEYLLDDDADEQESYSERDDSSISNRSLLANALESLVSDDKERSKIAEYKASLEAMEAEEEKLRELNAQIKELSFAKGKRDMEKIRKLRDEARKTTNRINIYDKQLLRLEAAKPLQKVLERERKRAYDRAKQKNKEAMAEYKKSVDEKFDAITQQYREQRKEAVAKVRKTSAKRDVRQKILNFKKRMEQRLLRPTDTQYVPAGLAKAMVDVCELINTKAESLCSPLNSFIKPALAVLHPIMTCTNGRWVAAPSLSCSQRPPVVKA